MKKNEQPVHHPAHYGGENNPYEAIKVIEAWGLGFNLGNTVKYISRAGKKDERYTITDLEKARWYLDREIRNLSIAVMNEDVASMDNAKFEVKEEEGPKKSHKFEHSLQGYHEARTWLELHGRWTPTFDTMDDSQARVVTAANELHELLESLRYEFISKCSEIGKARYLRLEQEVEILNRELKQWLVDNKLFIRDGDYRITFIPIHEPTIIDARS